MGVDEGETCENRALYRSSAGVLFFCLKSRIDLRLRCNS